MPNEELRKKRDELLKGVKQNKSEEYKEGYIDGVLDMYNADAKPAKKTQDQRIDDIVDSK